jgi:uncharacterized protein YgbK (DUF1537 family)
MLTILADDLTGALDCAAPFAGRGLRTWVALGLDAVESALEAKPAVLSVNLATREVAPRSAAEITRSVISRLPRHAVLFKKVDSRLKGNIAAELDATPYHKAVVAPAIPKFGRVVRNGRVEGFGVQTPIDVAAALGVHANLAFIPDTVTQDDMFDVLNEVRDRGVDLYIGARGLAEALAEQQTGRQDARLVSPPAGPGVFVIGSRDPITLAQIDALRQAQELTYLAAPNGMVELSGSAAHSVTLVQATAARLEASPVSVSDRLAAGVVPSLSENAATLVLSGGATAEAVLKAMNIATFELLGECLPGLGLAYVNGQCIIAKSGGFGTPETLVQLASAMAGTRG